LLFLINHDQQATLAVSRALLDLVAIPRSQHGAAATAAEPLLATGVGIGVEGGRETGEGGGRGGPLAVAERIALAAADVHWRLRKALPLLMSNTPIATATAACGSESEHDVWAVPWGEQYGGGKS